MEELLRKWARKFFEKQIRVCQISMIVSCMEMMDARQVPREYREHDMVRRIAEFIHKEGLIEFEEQKDYKTGGVELRAKIRVI